MNKKILYPVLVLALGLGVATLIATNKPALDSYPVRAHGTNGARHRSSGRH